MNLVAALFSVFRVVSYNECNSRHASSDSSQSLLSSSESCNRKVQPKSEPTSKFELRFRLQRKLSHFNSASISKRNQTRVAHWIRIGDSCIGIENNLEMWSRTYCCAAIPLCMSSQRSSEVSADSTRAPIDNSGIYAIITQFLVVSLVAGVLSFAAPTSESLRRSSRSQKYSIRPFAIS